MKIFLQRCWIVPLVLLLSACNGGSSGKSSPQNHQPVANAGEDMTVTEKQLVTLDGSASHDPDEDDINYKWIQVDGPFVELSSDEDDSPSFIAPDGSTTLRYQLH
ncbi:PKD domain-containing protein, partial [Oleiphilus sp. HI0086]